MHINLHYEPSDKNKDKLDPFWKSFTKGKELFTFRTLFLRSAAQI